MIPLPGSRADAVLAAMDLIATLPNRDQVEIRPSEPEASEAVACQRACFAEPGAWVPFASPEIFPVPDPEADHVQSDADRMRSMTGKPVVMLRIAIAQVHPIESNTLQVRDG